jgi:hypothetical protein
MTSPSLEADNALVTAYTAANINGVALLEYKKGDGTSVMSKITKDPQSRLFSLPQLV